MASRSTGIDRRTIEPALLVLALAVLMGVILPSIDSGEFRSVTSMQRVAIGRPDGITLVPTTGWDLGTGALVGHPRSDVASTAGTELIDGSVKFDVQTVPFSRARDIVAMIRSIRAGS